MRGGLEGTCVINHLYSTVADVADVEGIERIRWKRDLRLGGISHAGLKNQCMPLGMDYNSMNNEHKVTHPRSTLTIECYAHSIHNGDAGCGARGAPL